MSPPTFDAGLQAALVVFAAMTLLWLWSVRLGDASIVDIFWGPAFVLVAAVCLAHSPPTLGTLALGVATAVWGIRLGIHLFARNRGRGEDYRYQAMRRRDSRFAVTSLLKVFWLQGVVVLVVSAPLWAPSSTHGGARQPDGALLLTGIATWIVGFMFEAVGDRQLAGFRADPGNRGKVLDRGLWRYTRHPNYFGDAVVWWGMFLISVANGAPLWSGAGPLVMTILLTRVSGVTLLERSLQRTKPQYAEYVRRTSAFAPWFPKPPGKYSR